MPPPSSVSFSRDARSDTKKKAGRQTKTDIISENIYNELLMATMRPPPLHRKHGFHSLHLPTDGRSQAKPSQAKISPDEPSQYQVEPSPVHGNARNGKSSRVTSGEFKSNQVKSGQAKLTTTQAKPSPAKPKHAKTRQNKLNQAGPSRTYQV